MNQNYDIPDSTDWLNTPLSSLSTLENALRCQICKDFFNTPMITSCSHTFCSLCIRRCLAQDGKCPACRASDDMSKLRTNWSLQEVVDSFKTARPAALELATKDVNRSEEEKHAKRKLKRKIEDTDIEEEVEPRRSQRNTRSRAKKETTSSQPEVISSDEETADADYQEEAGPDDGLVPCPMCGKRMKEEAVFPHLDKCEDEQKAAKRTRSSQSRSSQPLQPLQPQRPSPSLSRLPQLNYSIYKDIALRKKLQELGIPAWGPKQLLARRHTEWINLWNSNCDSSRPRSKNELLRELDFWERSQGGSAREPPPSQNVMRKDFDGKGWAQSNTDQFQSLIAAARAKRAPPKEAKPEEKSKDDDRDVEMSAEVPKTLNNSIEDTAESNGVLLMEDEVSEAPTIPSSSLASVRKKIDATSRGILVPEPLDDPSNRVEEVAKVAEAQPTPPPTATKQPSSAALLTSPTKKVPMFALPKEPVKDVEPGQAVQ